MQERDMKLLRVASYRQLLAAARERASLTPSQLADRVGMGWGFVRKYEGGAARAPSHRR
jgi:ribosome-binding protein aMBF1 (putative translation factor)